MAAGASVLAALLATAAWLEPSPQGLGTHQGLGLPRCTVLDLWGVRCPSCGMTTSWAHWVRASPLSAMRANAGGTLLGFLATFATPWLAISSWRGEWWKVRPTEWTVVATTLAIGVVTLVDWGLRIGWR